MDGLMWRHAYVVRSLSLCAAVVLAGSVAACGGDEPGEEPDSGTEPAASAPAGDAAGAGFCDSVDGIRADLDLVRLTEIDDPGQYPAQVSQAAQRFATVTPPEPIAVPWQHVGDFLAEADEALRDVEVETEEDIGEALHLEGEEAFGMLLLLPGQADAVGAFVQDECQVDLGITAPAVADVCAAVDLAHLQSVFDGAVPDGENVWWGGGAVECTWDDGDDREVGVVVLPAEAMRGDILAGMSPLESVQLDGATIDVYDGAFGPFRAAGGRTAATVVGDTGVLASVRSGDPQAEAQKAIALAGLVSVDLS